MNNKDIQLLAEQYKQVTGEQSDQKKYSNDFVKWVKSKYEDKWKFVTFKDKHIGEFEQEEGPLDSAERERILVHLGKKFGQFISKPKPKSYDNSPDWGDDEESENRRAFRNSATGKGYQRYGSRQMKHWGY